VTVVTGAITVARLVQKDVARRKSDQDQAVLRDTIFLERADNGQFRQYVRAGIDELLARRPDLERDTVFVRLQQGVRELASSTAVHVTSEYQVEMNPRP
jgi:hypothetical protein